MIVLLHLGYWMTYVFLISWVVIMMRMGQGKEVTKIGEVVHVLFLSPFTIIFFAPALICFYANYNVLFQKFLVKKKFVLLALSAVIISLFSALVVLFSARLDAHAIFADAFNLLKELFIFALLGLFHGVAALVMRGFIGWYGDIKLKEDLNRKNHETELALMKSQLHPHFLFNTINNIDMLIQKDPEKASAYLNKLSDIMRFMLYEIKTKKILLSKELTYIDKYIELQRIRTKNVNYINYTVEGDAGSILIEPLLFIPFIENAFKHAENKKIDNAIGIIIIIRKEQLEFECQNHYTERAQVKPGQSGLGNELIKKRLELLYPGKHHFTVNNENGIYKVNLSLTL
jgi:two-component system LytT family sensor kinase